MNDSLDRVRTPFFEHSSELQCLVDAVGHVVIRNPAWKQLGLSDSSNKFSNLIACEDCERVILAFQRLASGSECEEVTAAVKTSGDSKKVAWVLARSSEFEDHVFAIGKVFDGSHSPLAVIHEERMQAMATFASGIAHELNNMLTPTSALSEFILQQIPETNTFHQHLGLMHRGVLRSGCIIRDLRSFFMQPSEFASPAQVDMKQLVSEIIDVVISHGSESSSQSQRPARVVHSLADVPPVQGDVDELRQAITHLLRNATESFDGEANALLTIRLEDTAEQVALRITDNGGGMSPAVLSRCREPFYTTKPCHSGLGLSAAAGIIRRHHGELRIQSSVDEGTTIDLCVPIAAKNKQQATDDETEHPTGLRMLVVDDEPASATELRLRLEELGQHVTVCDEVAAAREALLKGCDVLFCSSSLGGTRGIDVVREIIRDYPDLPVVMCTKWSMVGPDYQEPLQYTTLFKPPLRADVCEVLREATSAVQPSAVV